MASLRSSRAIRAGQVSGKQPAVHPAPQPTQEPLNSNAGLSPRLVAAEVHAELHFSGEVRVNRVEISARLFGRRWVGSKMGDHKAFDLRSLCKFANLTGGHVVRAHMPFEPCRRRSGVCTSTWRTQQIQSTALHGCSVIADPIPVSINAAEANCPAVRS
jgi:hypothetical protein